MYQCRNLPSGDKDGTSDAKVVGYSVERDDEVRHQRTSTQVSKDNLNPVFYEAIDMQVCYGKSDSQPPFILDVFDHDSGILKDGKDFLGRAIIKADKAAIVDCRGENVEENNRKLAELKPKWETIRGGNSTAMPKCGEILCKFARY